MFAGNALGYVRKKLANTCWRDKIVGMKLVRKFRGFTLIELLVVISIIAMLLAILMPSLTKSREQSKRVVCMANLHAIGQSLYIYAHDFDGMLVPGECQTPWNVWSAPTESTGCEIGVQSQSVNLGHLLSEDKVPMPTGENHIFFCPSANNFDRGGSYDNFKSTWGKSDLTTYITYMFNNSLDGFDSSVDSGQQTILFHTDKVNYLMTDASVHVFNVKKLVYDVNAGPEGLAQVCSRTGVCFPTSMLHEWFTDGQVDLDEAKEFLANPLLWVSQHATGTVAKSVRLSNIGRKSLVADVVGGWKKTAITTPRPPVPG